MIFLPFQKDCTFANISDILIADFCSDEDDCVPIGCVLVKMEGQEATWNHFKNEWDYSAKDSTPCCLLHYFNQPIVPFISHSETRDDIFCFRFDNSKSGMMVESLFIVTIIFVSLYRFISILGNGFLFMLSSHFIY